jgi:NitT/TauT family transport system substrate-binding protein
MERAALFAITAIIILAIIGGIIYYTYEHTEKQKQATQSSTQPSTGSAKTSIESPKSPTSTETSTASKLPEIRIGTIRGGISSLDVILAKKLDEENGFRVKLVLFTATLDLANAIAHGDVDVAIIPAEFVAKLREKGTNVTILAVDFYQNQAIVVQGDENITSIEDLKGKKVAAFKPTGTYAMFKAYMKAIYGLNAETSFNIVNLPPPQIVQAFAKKEVDAAVIWEPFVSRLIADYGGKILVSYQELWQKWEKHIGDNGVMIVYAARGDWAAEHPELVEKLLAARSKAASIWNSDERLAEKILVDNYGLSEEAAKLCWNRLKMEVAKDLTKNLVKNILAVWELAREGGYISSQPESLAKGAFWEAGQ